ncbi:hypothetical protein BC943DRAFT_336558 [Umbelopsis sp. AD052]|nr:hypothetical protein BC943DRAFT_336558 [Umbelopsis sp. AD052]
MPCPTAMPPRYSSDYDRHTGNPALPNGKPMYRDTVDDPYRSRKDHKLNNADAYRYDHMSNNSQQRQQPPSHHHSSIHHSRKTSISSSLPQKYYAMIKHQLANDDPAAPYERPYHTQPYSPTPKFDRPTMYYNAPPRKQSQQYSRPNHHAPSERRRSSMSYSHYPPHESSSQPPSRYRPADMYQPPPQQQLMTQPLTAYLRDRNTGVPR